MSSKSLATVAQQVITTYGNTAKNVIHAYRVGGERAFTMVDQTFAAAVDKTAERVNPKLRSGVVAVEQLVSGFYAKRVSMASDGADFAVNRVVTIAEFGVTQVAANANRFEKATRTQALSNIAAAALPAAQAVNQVGIKLEARSEQLVSKIAGTPAKRKASTGKAVVRKAGTAKTVKPASAVKAAKAAPVSKAAKPAKARAAKPVTAKVATVKAAPVKAVAKRTAPKKAAVVAAVAAE